MSFMSIFGKRHVPVFMVVDVGTHAIRALTFEVPNGAVKPTVIKKYFFRLLPASLTDEESVERHTLRVSGKLRELMFAALKELGRVPKKIWIGIGPHLAPYSLEIWEGEDDSPRAFVTKDHAEDDSGVSHDRTSFPKGSGSFVC